MKIPCRPLRWSLLAVAFTLALPAPGAAKDFVALNSLLWPPYYLDKGEQPGFARELLEACIPAGYQPRFSALPIEQMYAGLRSGVVDGHVLSYDKGREGMVIFGKVPLFSDAYRPVVRAGSGVRISGLADFDRLELGHLAGLRYSDAFHDYLLKRTEAGRVHEADSNEKLLNMLLERKVDTYVSLASTAQWLARSLGHQRDITVLPYEVKSSDYFFAISRQSRIEDKQGFLDAFDKCLQRMRQDGRYRKLRNAYGLE